MNERSQAAPVQSEASASGRVGIVVAAYNAADWITETLESISSQSRPDLSCVVVDDGSLDGTAAIADTLVQRDPRFRVVRRPNGGVSAARNTGLAELDHTCELVCFVDSDDVLVPSALEVLCDALAQRPDAVGLSGWAEYMDADGTPIRVGEHRRKQQERFMVKGFRVLPLPSDADTTFAALIARGTLWPPATVLVRRCVVTEVGGFDESLPTQEDWDLFIRMSRHGPFAVIDRQVAWYRVHDSGLTRAYRSNLFYQDVVRRKTWRSPGNSPVQRRVVGATWRAQQVGMVRGRMRQVLSAVRSHELSRAAWSLGVAFFTAARLVRSGPQRPSARSIQFRTALEWRADGQPLVAGDRSENDVVDSSSAFAEAPGSVKVLASPGPNQSPNANPYLRLLYEAVSTHDVVVSPYSRKALLHHPDVVHVHWPAFLVRWQRLPVAIADAVKTLCLLWLARHRGAAVVWTGHDLEPHDVSRPWLWAIFFRLFLSQVDLIISMGDGATDLLIGRYPQLARVPVAVAPHGHYRDAYATAVDAAASRQVLGLDERPVLLVFGQIRAYKNIPALVQSWKQLLAPRPQLIIAGEPRYPEVAQDIRDAAGDEPDALLLLRLVDADEIPRLFAAADVVVLPYHVRSALNSGVAVLALSFGRPVVVSDSAANRDLQRAVGADWVYLCEGTPDDALRVARGAVTAERPDRPDLSEFDWQRIGDLTVTAYDAAVSARHNRSGSLRARRRA